MTEQQPTEQQIIEAAEAAGLWPNTVRLWMPAFHRYHELLAKNIDTASPSPASLRATSVVSATIGWVEQALSVLEPQFLQRWNSYYAPQLRTLATPQPSPTGPTQVEPGSAERYAEQERKARSVPPTGPREGEPT